MDEQTQYTNNSPTLPIFVNSLIKENSKQYIDVSKKLMEEKKNECFICFNNIDKKTSKVSCSLCCNYAHYECYKNFIKKNNYYANKCLYCNTKTIKYDMNYWWNCCF